MDAHVSNEHFLDWSRMAHVTAIDYSLCPWKTRRLTIKKCFSQVAKVLKPGGVFLICNESDGEDKTSLKYEQIIDGMKCCTAEQLEEALAKSGLFQSNDGLSSIQALDYCTGAKVKRELQ